MSDLMNARELADTIDSTNLRLDATDDEIVALCEDARTHGFACVMLYPSSVALAASILGGEKPRIGTVIGFPSGRFTAAGKLAEMKSAAEAGATEADVVMNYPALREGRTAEVAAELEALAVLARERGLLLKVIVETCFLDARQRMQALHLCEAAGVDFIKTSTGFGTAGAQEEHVREWSVARTSGIGLKASGGIKSLSHVRRFLEAGASRVGTSSAVAIMDEFSRDGS